MLTALLSPAVIGIAGAVLGLVLVVALVVKRYRIVEPDTAMIVVGNRGRTTQNDKGQAIIDLSGQKVVTGGGTFVWPFIQKAFQLSLRSRRLALTTTGQTKNGITLSAQAVAVIKVGGSEEMIRAAAQRFLSQQDEIEESAQEVLSGSLRSILGNLTVLEIIQDRQAVASYVLTAAEEALSKQGLVIDTLQIQEIRDSGDYIANLGRPEAAAVRQNAEIADTEANRASEAARIEAEKVILDRNRELRLREAEVQAETDKASALAASARPLEAARQQQLILEQETLAAEREAQLEEQRLSASVRKAADAEAYRIEQLARAEATAQIARADADKQEKVLAAEGLAATGRAEAEVVLAKGQAEAEAISARADALAKQPEALLGQQMIEALPEAVGRMSEAYASIGNLTVISTDGANQLTGDAIGNVTSMQEMLQKTIGVDLGALITGRATGEAIGSSLGKAQGSRRKNQPQLVSTPVTPEVSPGGKATQPTRGTNPQKPVKPEPLGSTGDSTGSAKKTTPKKVNRTEPESTPVTGTGEETMHNFWDSFPEPSAVMKEEPKKTGKKKDNKQPVPDHKEIITGLSNVLKESTTLRETIDDLPIHYFEDKLVKLLGNVEQVLTKAKQWGIAYDNLPLVSDKLRNTLIENIVDYEELFSYSSEVILKDYPLISDFLENK